MAGIVFTTRAVMAREYPTTENLFVFKEEARQGFRLQRAVRDAIFIGSAARNNFNFRSDIDTVYTFNPLRRAEVQAFIDDLIERGKLYNVRFNFTPVDTVIGQTSLHGLSAPFIEIASNNGDRIKGNLRRLAKTLDLLGALSAYFQREVLDFERRIAESAYLDEDGLCALLETGLSTPVDVARQMVFARRLLSARPIRDEPKYRIIQEYRRVMPKVLADQLEGLVELDRQYTEMTWRMLSTDMPDDRDYRLLLSRLKLEVQFNVIPFLQGNALEFERWLHNGAAVA